MVHCDSHNSSPRRYRAPPYHHNQKNMQSRYGLLELKSRFVLQVEAAHDSPLTRRVGDSQSTYSLFKRLLRPLKSPVLVIARYEYERCGVDGWVGERYERLGETRSAQGWQQLPSYPVYTFRSGGVSRATRAPLAWKMLGLKLCRDHGISLYPPILLTFSIISSFAVAFACQS